MLFKKENKMFSGIITYLATVKELNWNNNHDLDIVLSFDKKLPNDLCVGESIAVNGACMTITNIDNQNLTIHVMNESLSKTNLKYLSIGDVVNGELAITPTTRLNGHIVTGHVDTIIELIKKENDGQAINLTFKVPQDFIKYIIYKGSVAINGVSLTVADVDYQKSIFKVCIIPHTQLETNLLTNKHKNYNLECDIYIKTLFIKEDFIK